MKAGTAIALKCAACCAMGLLATQTLATQALASGEPRAVAAALDGVPTDARQRCAYTRISIEDDETETERFDPTDPDGPWTLVSINGREPSQRELRHYDGKKKDREDRNHPLDLDIREMVDPDSWQFRSEDDSLAVFEFRLRPHGDLSERLVEKVAGSLSIDKASGEPTHIRIENTEPASVAPFVRVARYSENLWFRHDAAIGAPVLVMRESEIRGRALGVKSLDRNKAFRYEDYACDGDMPAAAAPRPVPDSPP